MSQEWKKMIRQMKMESIRIKSPAFFAASGGFNSNLAPNYSDKTTNGLTQCIIEFLMLKGHYCNRINTQGQARVTDVQRFNIFSQELVTVGKSVKWTKGTTRQGTPDIDAIISGRPVKIEVKVGSDEMREAQKKERAKIEGSGGLYFIAKRMSEFLEWYKENIETLENRGVV